LGKAFASIEELHWAVEVPVTVEDEGFWELQGNGGFACAGGSDEKERLRKRGEKVGGGFHLVKLIVEFGEQEIEAAKCLSWVEGEERADLGEFVLKREVEFSKDLLLLAGGVVEDGCGGLFGGNAKDGPVKEHLVVVNSERGYVVGDGGWGHLFRQRKRR
jgi:hypothetical protein